VYLLGFLLRAGGIHAAPSAANTRKIKPLENIMAIKHCRHIKVDGTLCQVPALRERDYCHFHLETLGRRMRMARARARREPYHLVLPILEDLNAVQVARMQIMDALTSGQIEPKVAGLLLYSLQGISADLRSAAPPRLGVYDPAIDTAPRASGHPGFEEKYDLPQDLDLSKPPEVVFAAEANETATRAEATARAERSAYRSNPWQDVNPEDVELEEILITQGEAAQKKRSAELESKEWKRIEQEKHKVAGARHILEAARRNGWQWYSGKLKEHYDKLWAEAAAKEKADKEEIAAMHSAARAQAAATKAHDSVSADEDGPTAGSESAKKPSATASGEEGDAATGQEKKSGT
jgi:hypothetical protein